MPVDLDTLIQRGIEAQSLLGALDTFCNALVEETLKTLDEHLAALTPEQALALCHEIAAYRRIPLRLKQRVTAGERAEVRAARRREELTQ